MLEQLVTYGNPLSVIAGGVHSPCLCRRRATRIATWDEILRAHVEMQFTMHVKHLSGVIGPARQATASESASAMKRALNAPESNLVLLAPVLVKAYSYR